MLGKLTRRNWDAHHATAPEPPEPPEPNDEVEVVIRRDGSALANGAVFPVPEGQPVHVAVLDAMHHAAQVRGEPVKAAILDLQEGSTTRVEVAPDGSSRILRHEGQEEPDQPEAGHAAGPLLAELPPYEMSAGEPTVAGDASPSDPGPDPAEPWSADEPFEVAPSPAEPPPFGGASEGAPPVAGDGLFAEPESVAADTSRSAGFHASEAIPADAPSAPEPALADLASAEPPWAEPPWSSGPPPAALPPVAGTRSADADIPVPAVPGQLAELVAEITHALGAGSLDRAVALAFRLREHTARSFGADHPCTLEARALEAFAAYRSGNHRLATVTSFELARIRCELGDARAHDDLTRAVVAWWLIDDIPFAVDHGLALLSVWSELAEQGVRAAQDDALMSRVNRRMHALATAADEHQTGVA
ncbi:hypothetical protein [Streptomyces olivaceus]|uniref:hypothetical protein n=1 Tax=Streptomyces olivaceus TaxID=47716 RepID=UPI004055BFE4